MKRLIILGAGYAGLSVAQRFDALSRGRRQWEVVLVDHRDYHLIQIRVHEVAANSIPAARVKVPLSELLDGRNIKFTQAKIEKIESLAKQVQTSVGPISYDRLVVALGSVTAFRDIPGLQEHAFPMKDLEDAVAYRKAVIQAFKDAAKDGAEPLRKNDPRLTFVIGGGGLTGTELAAEMVDFCNDLCNRFPAARKAYRVVLVEAADHLLPQLSRANGEYIKEELRYKNVAVLTSTFIERVEPGKVYLKNGKVLSGNVICWAGGIQAPAIIRESGFETTKDGRIPTDKFLRSTQFPDVYALGDCAAIPDPRTGKTVPLTGQYAELEGHYIGESLHNEERGQQLSAYQPFTLGTSISLGRREALTLSGPLRLTGLPGRLAKDVSYGKYEFAIRSKLPVIAP